MQCIRLSVPQELYNQLGLQPNKTLVFKSSKDLCKPNSQEISVSTPQSSQATTHSEEPALPLPEINDSFVGGEGNATRELVASVEKYKGAPKTVLVNASDIVPKRWHKVITYPRLCTRCGKMNNCKSSYYKHKRVCGVVKKKDKMTFPCRCLDCGKLYNCKTSYYDHRKQCGAAYRNLFVKKRYERKKKVACVRYCVDDEYSDSFDDLYDEEMEGISAFVNQLSEGTTNDEGQETLGSDTTQVSTDSGRDRKETRSSDVAQISADSMNDAQETIRGDMDQVSTNVRNDEQDTAIGDVDQVLTNIGNDEQDTISGDMDQVSTNIGNGGQASISGDMVQISTDSGNNTQEAISVEMDQISTVTGNAEIVQGAVNNDLRKSYCQRICLNCCRSYCTSFGFKSHLKMCDEYKRKSRTDLNQLLTDSGKCAQEAINGQVSIVPGNTKVVPGKAKVVPWNAKVVQEAENDGLQVKSYGRRICANCRHSYCSRGAFHKHLQKCDEYKRRNEAPKKEEVSLPEYVVQTRKPNLDDVLVNELSKEEKPVQWFPVANTVCAKPFKNLKYFFVKKT